MNPEVLQKLNTETVKFFNPIPENVVGIGTTYDQLKYTEGYEKPSKEAFEAKLQELIDAHHRERPLKELRAKRNKLLTNCDWVTIKAYSTQKVVPKAWRDYMQALRDLPSTTEDPTNPVWPVAPTS
jgi:hypothetical protein